MSSNALFETKISDVKSLIITNEEKKVHKHEKRNKTSRINEYGQTLGLPRTLGDRPPKVLEVLALRKDTKATMKRRIQ